MTDRAFDELVDHIARNEGWNHAMARGYARFLLTGGDLRRPDRKQPAIPGYLPADTVEYINEQWPKHGDDAE